MKPHKNVACSFCLHYYAFKQRYVSLRYIGFEIEATCALAATYAKVFTFSSAPSASPLP